MHFSIGFLSYDFYEKRYATNYMYPGCQRQPTLKHPSEKNISRTSVPRHIRQGICHDLSHEFSKHNCFQNKENYTAENLKKFHLDEKTV